MHKTVKIRIVLKCLGVEYTFKVVKIVLAHDSQGIVYTFTINDDSYS